MKLEELDALWEQVKKKGERGLVVPVQICADNLYKIVKIRQPVPVDVIGNGIINIVIQMNQPVSKSCHCSKDLLLVLRNNRPSCKNPEAVGIGFRLL